MNYNWSISILIIILSLSFNFSSNTIYINKCTFDSSPLNDNQYQIHEPIVISSEDDLYLQGWPGNGTQNSPYLIEGLNITSSTTCISVSNIQVYLTIKDCILNAAHPYATGCTIIRSKYVQLSNCNIESQNIGIELVESEDCSALNNTILDGGFILAYSHECSFVNNSLHDCGFLIIGDSVNECAQEFMENKVNGKQLGYFLHVNNSIIDGEQYGQLLLVECENVQVENGEFSRAYIGIQIAFSNEIMISNVIIRDNSYSGIWILHSYNIALFEIESHGSDVYGIVVQNSRISVSNSIIRGNMQGGIYSVSSDIEAINNRIFNNRGFGGIYIFNSSGECVIRSNMVYLNQMLGISLIDTVESTILDNYVEEHRNTGIYVVRSGKCVCKYNNLVNNAEGIYAREMDTCEISQNRISGSDDFAIHFFSMTEIEVFNNTLVRNWNYGFYMNEIVSCFITFNHVYENGGIGMYFYNSTNCLVDLNNVYGNDKNGIGLALSEDFYIQGNSLHENDINGMHLSNSNNNEIRVNRFFGNRGYGLLLTNSNENIILNNTFYLNIEGNARDDGEMNRWNSLSGVSEGNWWDDWNGSEVYYIEGSAGSEDRYPSSYIISTNMTTTVFEFGFEHRIIISIIFVSVGVLAMNWWYRERK